MSKYTHITKTQGDTIQSVDWNDMGEALQSVYDGSGEASFSSLAVTNNTTVGGPLTVNGDANIAGNTTLGNQDNSQIIVKGTVSSGHSSGALCIDDALNITGNVGIGINNPTEKLEINGLVKANDFIRSDGSPAFVCMSYPHVYKADGLFPASSIDSGQLIINTEVDFKWNFRGVDYLLTDFSESDRTLSVSDYGAVVFSDSGFKYISCSSENEVAAIESTYNQMVVFDVIAGNIEAVPNWFNHISNGNRTHINAGHYVAVNSNPSEFGAVPLVLPRTPVAFLQGIIDMVDDTKSNNNTEHHVGIRVINRRLCNVYYQRSMTFSEGITIEWGYIL